MNPAPPRGEVEAPKQDLSAEARRAKAEARGASGGGIASDLRVFDSTMALAVVNISELLDARDLSAFQKRVIALCAAIAFVDGIEGQLAGYIAPALRQDLALTAGQLTSFLVSGPL